MEPTQTTTIAPAISVTSENQFKQVLFHPMSVLVMFLLDWGGFVLEIPQIISPFTLVFTFIGIFVLAGGVVYYLQRQFAGESKITAITKGALAAFICAIPLPVMSTFIGTIILTLSGLGAIRHEGLKGLISMFKKHSGA